MRREEVRLRYGCWGFGKGRFAAWLIAIIWASKGEWYKLPLIGDFAEKTARG
jgi:uncharacterized membrane protein